MPKVNAKRVKKRQPNLSKKLKDVKQPKLKCHWAGPEEDGISVSKLGRFLTCRERFRIEYILGLRPEDKFQAAIEYGQMWHTCEEYFARGEDYTLPITSYCRELSQRYPTQGYEIEKWYNVCQIQFPIYVDYWSRQRETLTRTPLLQEEVFRVPYKLPSGRTVQLKGIFDGVDLIGKGKRAGIYLVENKTKGTINEQQLVNQLTFDIQTNFYLVALTDLASDVGPLSKEAVRMAATPTSYKDGVPIKGIRYNVVRRPLSGGKGNIRPHKATKNKPAETMVDYYERLRGIIELEADTYFMRWKVEVTPEDIDRYKREFLTPILEQLCEWYDWISSEEGMNDPFAEGQNVHLRFPYGSYSNIIQGATGDLDEYLRTGSTIGLKQV